MEGCITKVISKETHSPLRLSLKRSVSSNSPYCPIKNIIMFKIEFCLPVVLLEYKIPFEIQIKDSLLCI